jgi:hypothetical protein
LELPSGSEVFGFDHPNDFSSVLGRVGIDAASGRWWEALMAACNSCFEKAMSEDSDVLVWGDVYVAVLDAARASSTVGVARVLKRKAVVRLVLLDRPECSGLDPDAICEEFLANMVEAGWDINDIGGDVARLAAGDELQGSRVAELVEIRQFIREFINFESIIRDESIRSNLKHWRSVFRI